MIKSKYLKLNKDFRFRHVCFLRPRERREQKQENKNLLKLLDFYQDDSESENPQTEDDLKKTCKIQLLNFLIP
jgi:hypothetical protein